jgi:hypothetical protein
MLTAIVVRVDLALTLRTLSGSNLPLFGGSLALRFLIGYVLAYQMSLGLAAQALSFRALDIFRIRLITTFYGLVLPGSLAAGGVTWYRLSRAGRRTIEAGAVLIYFRLVDTLTLVCVGVVGTWFDPRLASRHVRLVLGAILVAVAISFLPFVSPSATDFVERSVGPLVRRWRLADWVQARGRTAWQAVKGFQTLGHRRLVLVLALSLLSHALGILNFHILASAVRIDLPVYVSGWVRSFLGVVQMIPVSIAGLGIREASAVVLLSDYGVQEAQALSFSLLIFAQMVVVGMVGGLLQLWDVLVHKAATDT